MTREGALLLMVGIAVILLGLMAWGWWRRTRRDARLVAPTGEIPAGAATIGTFEAFYVATTVHDQALERLAVSGLGYRSRAGIVVTDAGVALDLTGAARIFLAADRLVSVGQATVAIDRVVERDGLVRLAWRIADDTVVDSYFRPTETSARALAAAIEPLVPSATPTGTDA
jgi:hypothetical protein